MESGRLQVAFYPVSFCVSDFSPPFFPCNAFPYYDVLTRRTEYANQPMTSLVGFWRLSENAVATFPWRLASAGYKVSQNQHRYTSNLFCIFFVYLFVCLFHSPIMTNPSVSLSAGGDFLESFRSPKKLNILLYHNNQNLTKNKKLTINCHVKYKQLGVRWRHTQQLSLVNVHLPGLFAVLYQTPKKKPRAN